MKKIVKSLLLVMTVFLFAGCSNSSNNQSAGSEGNNGDYSKLRVALISDTIGKSFPHTFNVNKLWKFLFWLL